MQRSSHRACSANDRSRRQRWPATRAGERGAHPASEWNSRERPNSSPQPARTSLPTLPGFRTSRNNAQPGQARNNIHSILGGSWPHVRDSVFSSASRNAHFFSRRHRHGWEWLRRLPWEIRRSANKNSEFLESGTLAERQSSFLARRREKTRPQRQWHLPRRPPDSPSTARRENGPRGQWFDGKTSSPIPCATIGQPPRNPRQSAGD